MTQVVNVKFRNGGKVYFFSPEGLPLKSGTPVIVDTVKGQEFAICSSKPYDIAEERIPSQLRPVVRIATPSDRALVATFPEQERQALTLCKRKVAEHDLNMKLINADFSFDGTKITFYFTADGRVDFRELVRDLGSTFHRRIELRQIGIRDGARMLGGIGPCGREFCCSTFLNEFQAISVKMAKTQSLSLNPVKISGACGNLMCCLKHEEEAYEDLQKDAPAVESIVDTPLGKGLVVDVNLLKRAAKVRIETPTETTQKTYPFAQLGYTINGEYRAPLEVPEVIEKAPAFEPPTYEPVQEVPPRTERKITHERTKEHIITRRSGGGTSNGGNGNGSQQNRGNGNQSQRHNNNSQRNNAAQAQNSVQPAQNTQAQSKKNNNGTNGNTPKRGNGWRR